MAAYRKLKSGLHQMTVRHPSGKRFSKAFPLKREAVDWAVAQEAAFRRGDLPPSARSKEKVGQWVERWKDARHVEPATAAKGESWLSVHILPKWKDHPIASIGRLDVQKWVTQMVRDGVGAPTVTGCYQLFSGFMSDAVLEGMLSTSPCREIDLPTVTRPAPRWLTRNEYDRIIKAATGRPAGEQAAAFIGLGCFSGLRPGEMAGLNVGSVDAVRRQVRVSQVVTRYGMKPYPKSSSSVRTVPFPGEVGELLEPLIAGRKRTEALFTSPTGERVSEVNWRNRVWRPALHDAGVDYERPYVMRHTCASWLVQKGVPDREIAKMLGHSSTRLVELYAHLAPDAHDKIRDAWGES